MFYLFLAVMGLLYMYLLLARIPLTRYIGYNYDPATLRRFFKWDDFIVKAALMFVSVLWVVTTVDNFYDIIY